jgi:hypothetical protein
MDPQIIQRESFPVLGVVTQIKQGSETPDRNYLTERKTHYDTYYKNYET